MVLLSPEYCSWKKELFTIPIAAKVFYGTYATDTGLVMASLLLAMLPILTLYIFLQNLRDFTMTQKMTIKEAWECPNLLKVPVYEGDEITEYRWVFTSADGFYYC